MKEHLVLYSVNTWLANYISNTYYNNKHYVWCSPYFDCNKKDANHRNNPPSSNPCQIYLNFKNDVKKNDKHSNIIDRNKKGLKNSAKIKHQNGVITLEQKKEIECIIKDAPIDCFRPLLYVIPVYNVHSIGREVPIKLRASVVSKEFIIDELPNEFFDIMEFEEVK